VIEKDEALHGADSIMFDYEDPVSC
jgi:hypothetical protein